MRTIRDCNVAVIGGAGFLGSHLVDCLVEQRACNVLVVDNLVAGRRDFVHPKATFEHADITGSEDYLRRLFQLHKIKFLFQFAAYPYVPDSFVRPLHVFNVNAMGAMKVINAAHEAGCEGVLQISSGELYGEGGHQFDYDHDDYRLDETADVIPHSTYGAAKAAVDAYCQVAWKERQVPVIALRQFNCIGERDEAHPYVIPEIARQLYGFPLAKLRWDEVNSREIKDLIVPTIKLGNNSFRDFLYAGDQARMAVELLEKGSFGEVYNLGSEEGIKIYDLAKLIGKLMGFQSVQIEQDPARVRPWEIWYLQSDNSKIYSVIESRPQVNLEEALRRTLNYFEETNWRFSW